MNLKISVRHIDEVSILDLSGRLVLGPESAALHAAIRDLLTAGEKKILLNLAGVVYIDSSGLGALVGGLASATAAVAQLKLLNLDRKVHDVIRTTHLHLVFAVFDDESKAIRSFSQAAASRSNNSTL